jgi:hypothetical protein
VTWRHVANKNCWWGGHGAQEVDAEGAATADAATLEACQASCVAVAHHGCDGVLWSRDGHCYRKRHLDVSACSDDPNFQLYLRNDPLDAAGAVPLIIDTDMSFDVDDVLAVCMAHAMHDNNEAKLLAVLHDSGYPHGIGGASVLSHFYGHDDDVTLGAYKGPFGRDRESTPPGSKWRSGPYVPSLVAGWPAPVRTSAEVDDAVSVYRRALAAASDRSVVIAAIGFATNLDALLRSRPDALSPLNGTALVAAKVRRVAWQGGWYAARHQPHGLAERVPKDEFNWGCGRRWFGPSLEGCEGTASYAVRMMPTCVEQIFSEVGLLFPTGDRLMTCADATNPCRQAMITTLNDWHQNPANGRASWDQMVTLMAVRGVAGVGGHKGGVGGTNVVDPGGTNHWDDSKDSNHSYLAMDGDEAWMKDVWQRASFGGNVDKERILPTMEDDVRQGRAPSILYEMKGEINRLLCQPPRGR